MSRSNNILEGLEMTTTIIGIIITAFAVEADKFTHFQHRGFTLVAFAGVLTVITSLVL
jgi:hypothetical protein